MNWYLEKNGKFVLNVYVAPRSSKSEIVGIYNDSLKIKLKAPPVDNEANEELIRFLAKKLSIAKSNIELVSGFKQKRKVLLVKGLNLKDLENALK